MFAVAMKVIAGMITSSPGLTPMARRAASAPLVQLLTSSVCFTPKNWLIMPSTFLPTSPEVEEGGIQNLANLDGIG